MNPNNMQNMMSLRGNGMGLQQRGGMPGDNPNHQIQRAIFQHISREPTQPGWWSTVTPQGRSAIVFQIVSSLRLIKPDMTPQQAIEVALRFERKAFDESQDKGSYENACRAKLAAIADTRSKQATGLQQRMQNSGGPPMQLLQQQQQQQQMAMSNALASMQMQGQLPQGFQGLQGAQQQMQPPHMQMQPNVQQSYQVNNGLMNNQPSMQQMQANPSVQGRATQSQFTNEESRQIGEIAQRNAQAASQEEVEMIKQRMNEVSLQQRQLWAQQGLEPYQVYFRQQAIKQFVNGKSRAREQLQAQAGGFNPQPISRNSSNQNQQPSGATSQANFEQSFPPNIQQNMHQQIRGLQQDALRKQDLGREVVPASNSQQQNQQPRGFQATPRQVPIQQPTANRSGPTPNTAQQQQNIQAQQIQNEKMQAARAIQAQNAMGSQAQLGQQTPLQGQLGGLSNQAGQVISQPSPSMPNLNRPMQGTPQQPQKQGTPTLRPPPQRPQDQRQGFETPSVQQAQVKQQQTLVGGNSMMNGGQPGNIKLDSLPPAVQAKMNSLPDHQKRAFLYQWIQRYQQSQQQQQQRNLMAANPQTSGPQGISPMPGQGVQSGRVQQPPSQQVNPGMFGQQQDLQMSLQPGQGMQQQSLTGMPNQFLSLQGQGRQFRDIMQNPAHMFQGRAPPLTEDQERQMAVQPFPAGILSSQLVGTHLPQEIKTWSQLINWAASNRHIVPQEVLDKLHGLQSLHYHQIMQQKAADMRQAQAMAAARSTPQPGPAPPAQMTQMGTPHQIRPIGPTGVPPLQMVHQGRMHQIQQPSMQDIQMARPKLPENLRNLPDDQIARLIMTRRMQLMSAQNQRNHQLAQQISDQQRMQAQQSTQDPLNRPLTQQQNLRKSNAASIPSRQPQGQPSRPGQQTANQMQSSQKSLKRSSTDDVIEVPNPNITQQEQLSRAPSKQGHPKQYPTESEVVVDQNSQSLQNRESQYEAELRSQAAGRDQRTQQQPNGMSQDNSQVGQMRSKAEEEKNRQRLRQLTGEVLHALQAQSRQPVAVDQATREKMVKILQDNKQLLTRMEESLFVYLRMKADEKIVRELISTRFLLLQQFRNKSFDFKEHFTISLEELEKGTTKLKNFFLYIMQMSKQRMNGAIASSEPQGMTGTTVPPSMPPLNAANLKQNQQIETMNLQAARQNSSQKQRNNNNRDSKAPAAPTSAQPPFPFLGAQSPQGVPFYGQNELTRDKLQLPPTKRRKGNPGSAISTPVQTHAIPVSGPSPQISKAPSPQVSRQTMTTNKLKCQAPSCKSSTREFATAEDLHLHTTEVHEITEPIIEDPLAWALESIRFGLGLDENGKTKTKPNNGETEKIDQAQAMKKSASTQGQTPLRREGSTPMSRAATQSGRHDSSDLLKTPQHGSITTNSRKPIDPNVTKENSVQGPITPPYDPWSDCPVSQAEVSALLPTLEDLNSSLSTWNLTPPSTVSSNKSDKNSPRPSDIGEDDDLKIQLNITEPWIVPGLYDNALFPPSNPVIEDDDLLGMDWETAFGSKGTKQTDAWGGFDPSLFSVDI